MSQSSARSDARSNSALAHWLAEHVLDGFDTPSVHLRPTIFHQLLLYMRKGGSQGRYAVPFCATGKFASVSTSALARVIAAILTSPEGYGGQSLELFGPDELTSPINARSGGASKC